MGSRLGIATVAGMVCLALAGCGKKEPTGQVVATVDGDEITAIDLRNEMGNFNAPNAQVRKRAEQAALQQIVNRKLIAKAAEDAGISKTPEFAQQKERMEEALLAQAWQAQLVRQIPPPSKEEIDKFVAEHPHLYAQRKIFEVDQIRMPITNDAAFLKALQPLHTLEDVKALLASRNLRFQEGPAQLDALAVPPQIVDQIVKVPADEVFVVPAGNLLVISHVRNVRVEPVTGDVAVKHATQVLRQTRAQETLSRQFGGVVQAGAKDVQYSKAYQPQPAATSAAPAAAPAKK